MPTIREHWIQEGIEQGIERGQQIGRIHLCERLLNRPLTPRDDSNHLALDELGQRAGEPEALVLPG